ncbi:MAG: TetR/AcrR family transcriptional regulator [Erysipelotrichaceae bacterium]
MRTQSEKYVDKYLTIALFSLMKKKSFDRITVTEITNKAGVGRNSFYRNFSSKEDIIKKWLDDITKSFLESSKINYSNDSLKDYFYKLFTHLNNYKQETSLIYRANLTYLLKDKFEETFLNSNHDKYDNYKSYFIIGGIFNIYYYWIINGYKETPQELSEKLVDLLEK